MSFKHRNGALNKGLVMGDCHRSKAWLFPCRICHESWPKAQKKPRWYTYCSRQRVSPHLCQSYCRHVYQAKTLGLNPHGPARGPLVRTFLDTLEKEKVKSKRQNFEDRGKNTLNDGYTKQELEKVSDYFLTEKNNHLGCRDRLCFFISPAMLCRSQTALGMNLFLRFHFENEPFPDFTRRENWYETVVFKGYDRFTPITYRVQHKIR